jgi:hypothetical protein
VVRGDALATSVEAALRKAGLTFSRANFLE